MEEKAPLKKIGTYLYFCNRSIVSSAFLIACLPIFIYFLLVASLNSKYWYLLVISSLLWFIWLIIQVKALRRCEKLSKEIVSVESKFKELVLEISKNINQSLVLLLTVFLSPVYFIVFFSFWSNYRKLKDLYDEIRGEESSWNIENDLDENMRKNNKLRWKK